MKARTRKRLFILPGILLLLAVLTLPGLYNGLKIQRYRIDADGINAPVRVALVSDLHSCRYGDGMRVLIDAVNAERPDLILLAGDIFDDDLPDGNTEIFLRAVGKRYPCYYVTGNHEYWAGEEAFAQKMAILEACGVRRLSNEAIAVSAKGQTFALIGMEDPCAYGASTSEAANSGFLEQLNRTGERAADGLYTVLLSHRPEYFETYADLGFDLALCGHAHGGQWRIPGLLNGLYAPNQGLFPKYAGGLYKSGATTMIVSRGLSRESTPVPRFYNRPELVIIDLQ